MKGIVLAGGAGTRLHPVTLAISKQLLPVYDKPMIYYPLSTLMLAGIREILIITTPRGPAAVPRAARRRQAVGHRAVDYAVQPRPEGLAQAFVLGRDFVGSDRCRAGAGRQPLLRPRHDGEARVARPAASDGATVFGYWVHDPERYGVRRLRQRGPRHQHRGKARARRARTGR